MKKKINKIFEVLDEWVNVNGSGRYVPNDFVVQKNKIYAPEIFGIQQVRNEILSFVKILLRKKLNNCLEIGLGYHGSTHVLWKEIFKRVYTIDINNGRILNFIENYNKFKKSYNALYPSSILLNGSSNDPSILSSFKNDLKTNTKEKFLDVLFIDGDHRYECVLSDWINYHKFVKKNGIVAFHDIVNIDNNSSVNKFLNELENGIIDGKKYKINKIIKSKLCGIGYYIV
jgi:hypothetical protein